MGLARPAAVGKKCTNYFLCVLIVFCSVNDDANGPHLECTLWGNIPRSLTAATQRYVTFI